MIKWKMVMSMSKADKHILAYRSHYMQQDVQAELVTPLDPDTGEFGQAKITYYIDGDNREFNSERELTEAITNRLRPNTEHPTDPELITYIEKRGNPK